MSVINNAFIAPSYQEMDESDAHVEVQNRQSGTANLVLATLPERIQSAFLAYARESDYPLELEWK